MNICITAATPFEFAALQNHWPSGSYQDTLHLDYHVSGVGPILSAISMSEYLFSRTPDLILNVGLAGALDGNLELGEVVHVSSEEFGDVGAELKDGSFSTLFDLGLQDPNTPPFNSGKLEVPLRESFAKKVTGVTVSTVHGEKTSIEKFKSRTKAQVESMEGASIMLVALRKQIPIIQLRAISNYVEPRNREGWEIELALVNLTKALDQLLSALPGALQARSARKQLGL